MLRISHCSGVNYEQYSGFLGVMLGIWQTEKGSGGTATWYPHLYFWAVSFKDMLIICTNTIACHATVTKHGIERLLVHNCTIALTDPRQHSNWNRQSNNCRQWKTLAHIALGLFNIGRQLNAEIEHYLEGTEPHHIYTSFLLYHFPSMMGDILRQSRKWPYRHYLVILWAIEWK